MHSSKKNYILAQLGLMFEALTISFTGYNNILIKKIVDMSKSGNMAKRLNGESSHVNIQIEHPPPPTKKTGWLSLFGKENKGTSRKVHDHSFPAIRDY